MDNYIGISYDSTIEHFGIKGMKWGIRTKYARDRLRNYSTYKKELRGIKSEYKKRKPTLLSKSLRRSGVASLGLGLISKNADFTNYGLSAIAGGVTLDAMRGVHAAKKDYKYQKKLLKKQYKESKSDLKRVKNNALIENKIVRITNNKRIADVDKQKKIIDAAKRLRG